MHRTSHAAIVSPRPEERRLAVVVLTSALPSGPGCGTDMVLVRRWRELARQADVVAIMPTPWAPHALARMSRRWAAHADTAPVSQVDGLTIHHPRYLQLPVSAFAPWAGTSMAIGARRLERRESVTSTVLYDGIDLERFTPGDRSSARRALGIAGDEPLVLFVGRLVRGKGLPELVDAFAAVHARQAAARLVVVGEGPLRSDLRARAAQAGIGAQVELVGEVPYERIPLWMQAADVFTVPSEAAGFPNVVREALACGRPVVATAVGDVPRVVTADVGRLVPVGDVAALADALLSALATRWDPTRPRAKVAQMTWQANATATCRFLSAAAAARAD